jgi:hypothetical protein
VLLYSGWRGALQKRTLPCYCALAGVVAAQQSRAPPGEGGLFDRLEEGGGGAWAALAVAFLGRLEGANFRGRLRRHREARPPRARSPNFLVWAILLHDPEPKRRAVPW